jgi:hypothetical protein
MYMRQFFQSAAFTLVFLLGTLGARADIFVTGFFSGNIDRFDQETNAQSVFVSIPGNPGLSGLAYDPSNNRLYASALNLGGVYVLDGSTGNVLNFQVLGFGPGGLTVSPSGELVVTDFTSNLVRFYDASFSLLGSVSVPSGVTSGVGYLPNGDLIIATAGSGVFRYDGISVTSFTASPFGPLASAQVAADQSGNVFIGHGIGFSDNVFKFATDGTLTGSITVTDSMLDGTGSGSVPNTNPSGVAIDADGNVIVAALGRSNPGDPGGERGGVLKFDIQGNLLETIVTGSSAYSGVVLFDPPVDAEVVDAFVYHNSWTGSGSAIDDFTVVHRESTESQALTIANLINSQQGITGVGFLIQDLAQPDAIGESDFEIQVSPQGIFDQGSNPLVSWPVGPAPSSIAVSQAATDQVLLVWADNQIENRWLRITLKATENTGLPEPVVFYVGHLLGETTGIDIDTTAFTVAFADISLIRGSVGSVVSSGDRADINKNGTVAFSDISAMRANVGAQLSNIVVPLDPPSE